MLCESLPSDDVSLPLVGVVLLERNDVLVVSVSSESGSFSRMNWFQILPIRSACSSKSSTWSAGKF